MEYKEKSTLGKKINESAGWYEKALVRVGEKPDIASLGYEALISIINSLSYGDPSLFETYYEFTNDNSSELLIKIHLVCFYFYTIAIAEIDLIGNLIQSAINNSKKIKLYEDEIDSLRRIHIDECYHSYVAHDALEQILRVTKVSPLDFTETNLFSMAYKESRDNVTDDYKELFDIFALCILESLVIRQVAELREPAKSLDPLQKIIKEHLAEEMGHSRFFIKLMERLWHKKKPSEQIYLAECISNFLVAINQADHSKRDRVIFESICSDCGQVESMIADRCRKKFQKTDEDITHLMVVFRRIKLINSENEHLFSNI